MFALIGKYYESGETQAVFCQESGISLACFRYWLRHYRNELEDEPAFVRLSHAETETSESSPVELCFPNGVSIHLTTSSDINLISQLIKLW